MKVKFSSLTVSYNLACAPCLCKRLLPYRTKNWKLESWKCWVFSGRNKTPRKRDRNGNNGTNVIISQERDQYTQISTRDSIYCKKVILGVFDISQNETRMEEAY